ncbi:MAG: hypothetical protein MK008_09320 [Bdellovibrionales bacterium]|nr:hypothetical protein [Bdellovibrionales bacterium]
MNDLNLLLKTLLESKLEFLVVGGFAAVVHGSSYVTKDLDITMLMSADNVEKLRNALKKFDPKHRMNPSFKPSFLEEPKSIDGLNNIYLETTAGILDIVTLNKSLGSFEDLKSRALTVELFGYDCLVLSLDDLINIKESMNRTKDKIVLEELKQIKQNS